MLPQAANDASTGRVTRAEKRPAGRRRGLDTRGGRVEMERMRHTHVRRTRALGHERDTCMTGERRGSVRGARRSTGCADGGRSPRNAGPGRPIRDRLLAPAPGPCRARPQCSDSHGMLGCEGGPVMPCGSNPHVDLAVHVTDVDGERAESLRILASVGTCHSRPGCFRRDLRT